jgi:nitrite reductase (NADH) large subunit
MMKESLVIIGNGMAAARLVEELRAQDAARYAVTLIGDEPRAAYNRVLLSCVLSGEVDESEIELKPRDWWRDAGVTLRCGARAESLDLSGRTLALSDGARIAYDRLVLATGSSALRLPLPGAELSGVHAFRTVADAQALAALGAEKKRVVVIGGGLLGLEAAYGLVLRGADVTLVHVMDRLMERQLDPDGAALLKRLVEARGVRILLNASATRIHGAAQVESVEFADGARLAADAVVFAVGVKPNAELAKAAGLATNRAILVDDQLETSAEGVYAIGECAEHRGQCYGLVEPAYEQARALAAHLCGVEARYHGSVIATNLKVSGVSVFSAGDFLGSENAQRILCSDPRMGVYKKLVIEDNRLIGSVLIGDCTAALWHRDLIRSGADVSAIRDELMFDDGAAQKKAA